LITKLGRAAAQLSLCRTGKRALFETVGIRRIRREERYQAVPNGSPPAV
jgi:hypothetical protein